MPAAQGKTNRSRRSSFGATEPFASAAIYCLTLSTVVWLPGGLTRFVLPKLLLAAVGILLASIAQPVGRLRREVVALGAGGLILLGFAALVGGAPVAQLMGRWPRYEGIIALGVYAGAAWAGARLLGGDAPAGHRRTLIRGCATAAIVLGLVAVIEAAGWRPLGGDAERPGGVAGNATDQGVLGMLLVIILSVPALSRSRDWPARAGLAGAMAAVAVSGSRTALLGLVTGLTALGVLQWWRQRRFGSSGPTNPIGLAVIATVTLGVAVGLPAVRSRLTLDDSLAGQTIAGRWLLWQDTVDLWTDRPWFGVGPSGFVDALPGKQTAQWAVEIGPANPPDSPHAWPLQALMAGGPLLLVAAVAMAIVVARAGWLAFRARPPSDEAVGRPADILASGAALAAVPAYGVALLTHFTTAATTILVCVVGGAMTARPWSTPSAPSGRTVTQRLITAAAAAWVLVLLAATAAEWPMQRALQAASALDAAGADRWLQSAETLRPWDADISLLGATALSRVATSAVAAQSPAAPTLTATALFWSERATERLPDSTEAALALASAQEATGDLVAARATYERLTQLSPANPLVWQGYGIVLAQTGDRQMAEQSLLKAAALAPDSPEPWENLAILYQSMGQVADEQHARDRAAELSG